VALSVSRTSDSSTCTGKSVSWQGTRGIIQPEMSCCKCNTPFYMSMPMAAVYLPPTGWTMREAMQGAHISEIRGGGIQYERRMEHADGEDKCHKTNGNSEAS
jgi:hypothetical protein